MTTLKLLIVKLIVLSVTCTIAQLSVTIGFDEIKHEWFEFINMLHNVHFGKKK